MAKIQKLKPSQKQVEDAIRTLMSWAGYDPDRQGLHAWRRAPTKGGSGGYKQDPEKLLRRTFDETGGYDEIITLRDTFRIVLRASLSC
jgi:GTP cyclohydrolase I